MVFGHSSLSPAQVVVNNQGHKEIIDLFGRGGPGGTGVSATPVTIKTRGFSIASGTFASLLGPDGYYVDLQTLNLTTIRSISVLCRKGNTGNADTANTITDNVIVKNANGQLFAVLQGEAVSFSCEDANTLAVELIACQGNAAALVTITYL